jgi:nucleoside-diphosphate-sugar epimerase
MVSNASVWVTGASGFIGSNIVEYLLENNYKIIVTKRKQTNFWRCNEFINNSNLIVLNSDDQDYESLIVNLKPDILIHSAWAGVGVLGRNDWTIQLENINYTFNVLRISKRAGVKKFIALGSQAEYGLFNGRVDETHICNPNSAYGAAKLAAYQIAKQFCTQNQIDYYWLRLFSVFGKKENSTWLVTSVINNILNRNAVPLSLCEQRYDYIDMGFLTSCLHQVIKTNNKSGVYNLGSNKAITLKSLVELIAQILPEYSPKLSFGALSYRSNQIMHMEGDASKFYNAFNIQQNVNLETELVKVINYLKELE